MVKLLSSLALLVCFGMATADDKPKDAAKPSIDPAKLIGDWTYESGVHAGEKVPKDRLMGKVKVTKDRLTIPGGPGQNFVMAYKIDTKTDPAQIAMEIKEGPAGAGDKARRHHCVRR